MKHTVEDWLYRLQLLKSSFLPGWPSRNYLKKKKEPEMNVKDMKKLNPCITKNN